jgi:cathepsin B
MKSLLMILILCATLNTRRTQFSQIVEEVNLKAVGWTAQLNPGIDYENEADLVGRLGALRITEEQAQAELAELNSKANSTSNSSFKADGSDFPKGPRKLQAVVSNYPASLDLRSKYPACRSISMIRNQGTCGACWSFATMNSLSDRWCIAKSGQTVSEKFFSVQDPLECCAECHRGAAHGCIGGLPSQAYKYARDFGVSTGETSSIGRGLCKPYFLEYTTGKFPPACQASCKYSNLYPVNYNLDRTRISGYSLGRGEAQMIAALNNGGSVTMAITVYEDLYSYSSGIYRYVVGDELGGHAVRVIGYGVSNGEKYWLIANTWGRGWGESGFFRMLRGTDECGGESSYFTYGQI